MSKAAAIRARIAYGLIMLVGTAALVICDRLLVLPVGRGVKGAVLAALMVLLGVMGFRELQRMAAAAGSSLLPVSGLAGVVLLGAMPVWWQVISADPPAAAVWALLGCIAAAVFLEQMIRRRIAGALANVAGTLLAVVYLGAGSALMLAIRLRFGTGQLILFLAAVKFTDIGAYFIGTAVGRHKLIPWLSPGKSWEGLAGGLLTAAGISALAAWAFRHYPPLWAGGPSPLPAAAFGVIVGAVGQFADLCESLLKRSAQVKDSGDVVPEFGGVLDIVDSPLLSAPVAYLLLSALA